MSDPGTQILLALGVLIAVPSLVAALLLRPSYAARGRPRARKGDAATPVGRARHPTPRPMSRVAVRMRT